MHKKEVKIAAVGMYSKLGDRRGNFDKTVNWSKEAKSEGAELVCFPELSLVPGFAAEDWDALYIDNKEEILSLAEEIPDGEATQMLLKLAEKLGIYICTGILEKENNDVYNTQILVGPNNYLEKYRKIHTYPKTFSAGNNISLFNVKGCRVGIAICWENLLFPEVTRTLGVKGVDILLHPAGPHKLTKKPRKKESPYTPIMLGLVRALENSIFVVCCWPGHAIIIDPKGRIVDENKEMAIGICDLEMRAHARAFYRRERVFAGKTN